jgi:hypothetical protein
MKAEGGRMKLRLAFILPPSSFILPLTRSLPLAVLLALAGGAQSNSPRKPPDAFQRAAGVPADKPSEFQFALGRFSYHVKPNGNGQRVKGEETRRFSLHFGPGEEIKYLYFASHQSGVLLTCEVLGEYGATSYAVRLDQPSMRARWTANVPATRTGEPARDGSRLYVTGKNFAGALDLE